MRNIWPARFLTKRIPFHKTRPPLMSLSGHSDSQDAKWADVGHFERSRPTSVNNDRAV